MIKKLKKLKKFDGITKIQWTNPEHSNYFTFGKIYQLILEGNDVVVQDDTGTDYYFGSDELKWLVPIIDENEETMKKTKISGDSVVITTDEQVTIVADNVKLGESKMYINGNEPKMSGCQPQDMTNDPIVNESIPFNCDGTIQDTRQASGFTDVPEKNETIDVEIMNIVNSFNRSLDNLNLVLTSYEISNDWPLIEFNILDSAGVDAATIKDKVLFWLLPYDKIYDDTMTIIVDKTVIKAYFNTPLDKLSSLITKYKNEYVYFTKQCYSQIRFKVDTVLRLSTKEHLIGFYRDDTSFENLEVNFNGTVLKDTPDKNETIQSSLEHYLPKYAKNNILSVNLTENIDSNDIVIKFHGLKESIHNHVIAMIDSPVTMCLHKSPNITRMYRDIVDNNISEESKSAILDNSISFIESLSKVDTTIKPKYYMGITDAERTKSIIDLSKIIDYLVKYYEPTFNNTAVNLNALGVELRYDKFSNTLTDKINSILVQLHEDFNKYSYGLIYEAFGDGMAVTFVADADVGKLIVCMQLSYENMLAIVNGILGIDMPIIEEEPIKEYASKIIEEFNDSSFNLKFDRTFMDYSIENEVKELFGIIQNRLNQPIDIKSNTIDVSGYYQNTVDTILEKLNDVNINTHIIHSVTDDMYTYKTLIINI